MNQSQPKGSFLLNSTFLKAISSEIQAYDSVAQPESQPRPPPASEQSPKNKGDLKSKRFAQLLRKGLYNDTRLRKSSSNDSLKKPLSKKKTVSFVCLDQEGDLANQVSEFGVVSREPATTPAC